MQWNRDWAGRFALIAALWLVLAGMPLRASAAPAMREARVQPAVMVEAPIEIPEPITIILFGTGLAAMAAAATVKRKR